jgi:hypothetical protein
VFGIQKIKRPAFNHLGPLVAVESTHEKNDYEPRTTPPFDIDQTLPRSVK